MGSRASSRSPTAGRPSCTPSSRASASGPSSGKASDLSIERLASHEPWHQLVLACQSVLVPEVHEGVAVALVEEEVGEQLAAGGPAGADEAEEGAHRAREGRFVALHDLPHVPGGRDDPG